MDQSYYNFDSFAFKRNCLYLCLMTFHDLNLNKSLLNALDDLGLTKPTAIQAKSFSPIMSGKDIVGIAQTGTGKTYAFLLPVLRMWSFDKSPLPTILIIVPTRELVVQIVEEVKKLTTYISFQAVPVYGGANMGKQQEAILQGTDMIVGTPGRLLDLMMSGAFKTKKIKKLIIDEVDEMLNLGFRTQLNGLLDFIPNRRQTLMFSATMPEKVKEIVDNFSEYYDTIEAAPSGAPLENIEQFLFEVPNFNTKVNLLELLLNQNQGMEKVLVFASTKKLADILFEDMSQRFPKKVGVIHSSKSQNYRFNSVDSFQSGEFRILIATDIIARGLDVSKVTHVVNFDLTDKAESYIHRIGRTGRAEKRGVAISFVSEKEQEYKDAIEKLMGVSIPIKFAPNELVVSDELIDLEKPTDFVPFNNHKMKQHKPSGPAFHEKSEKNKKVNLRKDHEKEMKKKYKKQYRKSKK